MTRDLSVRDLVELEKYAKFPLLNLRTQLGSVIVTNTAEVSIVLADRSIRDKIRALRQIEEVTYRDLISKGFRDAHIFVMDPKYAEIMVKHFGFEYVEGQALVRRA